VDLPLQWHFIGHLQSNKAKYAVRMFDLIHTVDSVKLAGELNKQALKSGKVQDILVQVNISGEATKSGAMEQAVHGLIEQVLDMPALRVRGFMTMPPFFDAPERVRPYFSSLRALRDRLQSAVGDRATLQELSMGMTGDFEVAIEEGATLVRIGTALFGARA
jgi:pyridoxal phosphate enzyme (YggS family)